MMYDRSSELGRVAIALRRRLDVDLLSQQLSSTSFCQVVMATTDVKSVMSLIRSRGAQAYILDSNYPLELLQQAAHAIRELVENQVLFLIGDYYSSHHAQFASSIPAAYCSRDFSFHEILEILERLLRSNRVAPSSTNGLIQSRRRIRIDHPITTELTDRELEVMLLLGEGHSIRECAKLMQLAESTVENHKYRLMRKLGVHRFTDVVRLAIRAGLINA